VFARFLPRLFCGGFLLACVLHAVAASVVSLTIEGPAAVSADATASIQYAAVAHFDDGSSADVTQQASWNSTNEIVAYMLPGGRVIFRELGSSTVSAGYGAVAAWLEVAYGTTYPPYVNQASDCATELPGPLALMQPGLVFTGPANDMVPWCNGRVVVANAVLPRVQLFNVNTGLIETSVYLPSVPTRLRLIDGGVPLLFVGHQSNDLARIVLISGDFSYRAMPGKILDIAPGEPGQVFVLLEIGGESWIQILDIGFTSLPIATTKLSRSGQAIEYSPGSHTLLLKGFSDSVTRYSHDPAAHTFAEVEYRAPGVLAGQDAFALSPDGARLVSGRRDLSADKLEIRFGTFGVDDARRASFRHDGAKTLVAGNTLRVFDVGTHVAGPSLFYLGCLGSNARASYSPSDSKIYAMCASQTASAIQFMEVGPPSAPPPPVFTPPPGISFDCAVEDLGSLTIGRLERRLIAPADALLPACDGRILIGNQASNRLETLDVRTGEILGTSQLNAVPLQMDRIPGTDSVAVRLDSTFVARANLATGQVDYVSIPGEPVAVTGGEKSEFFVNYLAPDSARIAVYHATLAGPLAAPQTLGLYRWYTYSSATRHFYGGGPFESTLARYAYDPVSRFFTLQQAVPLSGTTPSDLRVSPDGSRLFFLNVSWDTPLPDIRAADLTQTYGAWNLGQMPLTGDFRAFVGQVLFGSSGSALHLADVASHRLLGRWDFDGEACSWAPLFRVRFSPGGYYAYAIGDCGAQTQLLTLPFGGTSDAGLPGAPTNVAIVADADTGTITLTFTPPGSDGGSPIVGYEAQCGARRASSAGSPISISSMINSGSCYVSARNANGLGAASETVSYSMPQLFSVVSRKAQAGSANNDITIDRYQQVHGAVTIEPRAIGSGHQIVFLFGENITSVGGAVCLDQGTTPIGSATAVASGPMVTVTITGIPDKKRVRVRLDNVNGGAASFGVSIGFLEGDVVASYAVDSADVAAVKARSGAEFSLTNAIYDIDLSGTISASDILRVKGRTENVLPP